MPLIVYFSKRLEGHTRNLLNQDLGSVIVRHWKITAVAHANRRDLRVCFQKTDRVVDKVLPMKRPIVLIVEDVRSLDLCIEGVNRCVVTYVMARADNPSARYKAAEYFVCLGIAKIIDCQGG